MAWRPGPFTSAGASSRPPSCRRRGWWAAPAASRRGATRPAGRARPLRAERSTMGIPLLHPWALRSRAAAPRGGGQGGRPGQGVAPPIVDRRGPPIHGLSAAAEGWRVDGTKPGATVARRGPVRLRRPPRFSAAFPFPHQLTIRATLAGGAQNRDRQSGPGRPRSRCVRLPPLLPPARGRERRLGHEVPVTDASYGYGRNADGQAGAALVERGPLARAPSTTSSWRQRGRPHSPWPGEADD